MVRKVFMVRKVGWDRRVRQVVLVFQVLKVSEVLSDPFSHKYNGVPSERYLDLHVIGDARLARYNDVPAPPPTEGIDGDVESKSRGPLDELASILAAQGRN